MGTNRVRFLGLILVLLAVVVCCLADSKESTTTGSDPKLDGKSSSQEQTGGSHSVSNSVEGDKGREKGDRVDKSKGSIGVDLKKNKADGQSGSTGKDNNQTKGGVGDDLHENKMDSQSGSEDKDAAKKGKGNLSEEVQANDSDQNKKENRNGGVESKDVPKEKNDKGGSASRMEGPRVEECDPSNRCMDEKNNLVACLRVSGNDFADLSLLIQNKGKGPLSVTIAAPDFVELENTKVQLKEKEDKKVKVSFIRRGNDNLIVLTAGDGSCKLDIQNTIAHYFGESDNSRKSTEIINFMSRTSTIAVLSFAVLLIVASTWMCISFRKKHLSNSSSKYQRLEMELPVSGGLKTEESEINDGWDNDWGDDWDDEEAPKTPSQPVTPSLSSKGLTPRRLGKDGWKD